MRKESPLQKKFNIHRIYDPEVYPNYVHAEINALSKIRFMDLERSKLELFLYRELKNGDFGLARPCEACYAAIKYFGIRNIYYTTNDGYAHEVIE
jgi:tRNA(Arg) A34 adenosine deaminase TadA